MATLRQCDGCGLTRGIGKAIEWDKLMITINGNAAYEFDLCNGCMRLFQQNHLPTKWTRHVDEGQ